MKITVITVAYNAENTIVDTLLSVQSQKNVQIEHIIIDGSSTDRTHELILNNINDQNTKYISEPDEGIYDAMSKGLELATGDIIGFLNADDVFANETVLSKIVDTIQSGNVDSCFGDLIYQDLTSKSKIKRRYNSKYFTPERVVYGLMPAHPTLYIKRSKIEEIGLFRKDYRIAGDFEYIVRAYYINKLTYKYINEVLVCMGTGGISTQSWRSNILLNHEILRACRENNIPTNLFKIYAKYPLKLLEYIVK